jgi:signal transduction histidine kinase
MSALYAWLHRHPRLVDGVLAAVLTLGGIATALGRQRFGLIPVTFGLTIPVVFRREHPVRAFAVAVGTGALQVAFGVRPGPPDLAIVILLYTLAAYSTRRNSVIGLGICLLGSAIEVATSQPPRHFAQNEIDWLFAGSMMFAGPSLIAWVLGDSVRYRRAYYANLEERAATLERERDTQARIAVAAERARIARELHDVVAHNVSVMVVQADGAAYALDADPGRARQALAAISATGRQALSELRVLLGVLRKTDGNGDATLAPQPGLAEVDELVDQARAAGLTVTYAVEGTPRPLPGGADLAAYRIVQESLTNARKHAGPQARASVRLRYTADTLEIAIADDGGGAAGRATVPDGAGHGLTGMRERAAMYGGLVRAGPRAGGGFQVTAALPFPAGLPAAADITARTAVGPDTGTRPAADNGAMRAGAA